jgi:hypothetical protein
MTVTLALVPALLFQAAALAPTSVPAQGRQEALLSLDSPSAVHLSATSASGTACEVVDRIRGAFASAGRAGRTNCELDLLLDAGQYKLRLDSARKGKGRVQLAVRPFVELNASPVRLVPGSGVLTALKPGQQASYWLSVQKRHAPLLRVAGRNAGDVRLWRNGEWLEPTQLRHTVQSPIPGQRQHEWWLDSVLEPGEYVLAVYGRDAAQVTGSSVDDSLTVEYGFREAPLERSVAFTLPVSGLFAVRLPADQLVAVATLDGAPASAVTVEAFEFQNELDSMNSTTSCRIDKTLAFPACALTSIGLHRSFRVLMVRGAPGTRGTLQWHLWQTSDNATAEWREDRYGNWGTSVDFSIRSEGRYLVGMHDVPLDTDGPPQACQVFRLKADGSVAALVARQATRLQDGESLEREFNVDEDSANVTVSFEIAPPRSTGRALLERSGASSRKFTLQTLGGLKSRCELFRVEERGELRRVTDSKPEATSCNETLALPPGFYQLELYGSLPGIEKLSLRPAGTSTPTPAASHVACLFPELKLEKAPYRLSLTRGGRVAVRGLLVRPLPLRAQPPLPLSLEAGATVRLALGAGPAFEVRSAGGAALGCSLESLSIAAQAGKCAVPALSNPEVLTLTNPGATPGQVVLGVPARSIEPPASPSTFSPTSRPPPLIPLDTPIPFDFARNQQHAVTFEVSAPGLYNLTTQGLLSTECRVRTPVVPEVARNASGGRGRNCLVQTWLQKGRYLLTVVTTGVSTGRASVLLTRRPPRELSPLVGEGESFFRVDPNDLGQQRLTVKSSGMYALSTSAQGQSLQCRLDDAEGWPVERVPAPCSLQRALAPGTYLWTQFPLTVESMRRTRFERPRPPVVLRGNKPHALQFFTWYDAVLGQDGKDEFLFTLEGDTAVDAVLTGEMQGRVYRLERGKAPQAVEVIPPQGSRTLGSSGSSGGAGSEPSAESEGASESPPPEAETGGDCEDGSCGGCGDEGCGAPQRDEPAAAPTEAPLHAEAAPAPPSDVRLQLPAGSYQLVTEHSRGDVDIHYRLHLGSVNLLPGMAREVPVPSVVPVLVPRAGTLRVRTEGDADVRCRLFDGEGRLVIEGRDNGADWNCAIAEPVAQGRYALLIESEAQVAGSTRLSLALPPSEDLGVLTDGAKFNLAAAGVTLALPVPPQDAVQDASFVAKTPFSCALENPSGTVVYRRSRATGCALLVRSPQPGWKVRLWTTDGTAAITASWTVKPVVAGPAGTIPLGQALAVQIPKAGRYRTTAQLYCQRSSEQGLLRFCGPETSLESGSVVFAAFGTRAVPLPLDELRATSTETPLQIELGRDPFAQAVTAATKSVFLMAATTRPGERGTAACTFDGAGTARELRSTGCFAASRAGTEAVARVWTAADVPVEASVVRRAIALPTQAAPLALGRTHVSFTMGVATYSLPPQLRTRLDVTLPSGTWAVLLGDDGGAREVCAPSVDFRRCVVTGEGGRLILVGPSGEAEITALALPPAPAPIAFAGTYEDAPATPGTLRLAIAAAEDERTIDVEGALRCTALLSSGERLDECRVKLPAHSSAELAVDHPRAPFRVVAFRAGQEFAQKLAAPPSATPGPALAPAVAVPVPTSRTDFTLVVKGASVLRVRAETGVCGLFQDQRLLTVDGLATGCELIRVLDAGSYRLVVRPFAGRPLPGTLHWSADPVSTLAEGVGPETWVAPGEVRLFAFTAKAKGHVGLGLQAKSDVLDCAVYDGAHRLLGEGCQQFLSLAAGNHLLTVRHRRDLEGRPLAFKPVLLGLSGDSSEIPQEYLQDFFNRIGASR